MELKVVQGDVTQIACDALIVNLFEGTAAPSGASGAVDQALGGAIRDMIAAGDLTGKLGEVGLLYPRGAIAARRVLVAGLGKQEEISAENIRRAAAAAGKRLRDLNVKEAGIITFGAGAGGLPVAQAAQATVEGLLLSLYQYDAPRQQPEKKELNTVLVVEFEAAKIGEIEAGVRLAETIVSGVTLARDLVNMPPNVATPGKLAAVAEEIARNYGMKLIVGDREWAAERKMGAFLAVGQGAHEPPKFIVLEHNPQNSTEPPIVLVGKGITFDTGGISIKPSEKMEDMKSDMAGAAAVLATMQVVGKLNLPLRVIGIAPATENMPDGQAYHPADVITASNGKTIEIISTDAEGRLILADALAYAAQVQPRAVVDLATLTGACVIALGSMVAAGLFSNDDALRDRLLNASQATGERLWPMPLYEDYRQKIKSDVADLKNSGGRYGGVGTSAIFLREFTSYPWAHLDIAGMALAEKDEGYIPRGGTGFGVRLLIEFLRGWLS